MQKFIAAILLLALVGQTFNQGWYYLSYLVQKKQYMAHCTNRSRPQMHCDGKCLLMKKINEEEKREAGRMPEMKFAGTVEVFSPAPSLNVTPPVCSLTNKWSRCPSSCGTPIDQPASIFHPPLPVC